MADTGFLRHLQQRDRTGDIVIVIHQRLRHGLADRFQSGEMDNGIDGGLCEYFFHCFRITDIRLMENQRFSGDLLHPFQRLAGTVAQIVHGNHVIPRFQQFHTGM